MHASRPLGYDISLDSSPHDIDLSSCGGLGDDLQRTKDEKLLEMLGEMAKGASDDEDVSSNVLEMCPIEVAEDDPTLRGLLVECGTMWEEVQSEAEAKRELHGRLVGELRQIQDRSTRQHEESSALTNRLVSAKQTLGEKLKEASSVHQDLRVRITDEWRGNERLRLSMSDGVRSLAALAEDLNTQVLEVGEVQARLVAELHEASESQARLQAELQSERVNTWRQSTDVVMAFARGSTPTAALAVPAPVLGFDDTGGATTLGASAGVSLPVANRRTPTSPVGAGKPNEDLTAQLLNERSSLMRAKAESAEEHAELEQRCEAQAQRISELNKELALEESARSQVDVQLEDFGARARALGIELPAVVGHGEQDGSASQERLEELQADASGVDFLAHLREVTEICEELQDREAECRRAGEEHAEAQEALQAEREEMDNLRTNFLMSESECEDQAQRYEDAVAALDMLRSEVQTEQAQQREIEQEASQKRSKMRGDLVRKRDELDRLVQLNRNLAIELEVREASFGCFRRRAPPSATVRQELSQKGGKGQRRAPSPGSSPASRSPGGLPPGKGGGPKGGGPKGGYGGGPKGGGPKGGYGGGRPFDDGGRMPPRGKGGLEAGASSSSGYVRAEDV